MSNVYGPSLFVEGVTGFVSFREGQDKFFQISIMQKDKSGGKLPSLYVDCSATEKAGKPNHNDRIKAKGFLCYVQTEKYGIKYSLKVTEFETLSAGTGKPAAKAAAPKPPVADPFADAAGEEDLVPFF